MFRKPLNLTLATVTALLALSMGYSLVGAAPGIGQMKQQLKTQVEAGQAVDGLQNMNANRAQLGLPPVTTVNGPPPTGGIDQPMVAGYGQLTTTSTSTTTTPSGGAVSPDGSGYGNNWYWVSMNKWVEADGAIENQSCNGYNGWYDPRTSHVLAWYANLCGPGSSEAITTNWNSNYSTYNGYYYYGYVASQSLHHVGYFFTIASEDMANTTCPENNWANYPTYHYTGWGTCDATLRDTINHEIGTTYYEIDWCAAPSGTNPNCSNPSYNDWVSDVDVDVASIGVPLVAEVMTCDTSNANCLPGWPYRADHFQAISQYDPTDKYDEYGETGNVDDACVNNYAPGAWTGNWTDFWNGHVFSESSGWDRVTNYAHFERTRQLTW